MEIKKRNSGVYKNVYYESLFYKYELNKGFAEMAYIKHEN